MEKVLREKTFNWLLVGAWDGLSWRPQPSPHGLCSLCIWDHRLQRLWIPFPALPEKKDPWVRGLGASPEGKFGHWSEPQGFPFCLRPPSDQGKFQIIDKMQIKGWHYPCLSVPSHQTIPPIAQIAASGPGEGQQGSSKTMWSLLNLSLPLAFGCREPSLGWTRQSESPATGWAAYPSPASVLPGLAHRPRNTCAVLCCFLWLVVSDPSVHFWNKDNIPSSTWESLSSLGSVKHMLLCQTI